MASIYKRGTTWWIHYLVEGRSVSRSLKTTNKRIAQDIKKNLEALEVTGQLPRPSKTPVGPLLQAYCEYLARTQTSQGARKDRSYLRAFFGPCCPALEPELPVPHKYRKPDAPPRKAKDPLAKRHVRVRTLEQVTPAVIASFVRTRVVHDGLSAKSANQQREVQHRISFATNSGPLSLRMHAGAPRTANWYCKSLRAHHTRFSCLPPARRGCLLGRALRHISMPYLSIAFRSTRISARVRLSEHGIACPDFVPPDTTSRRFAPACAASSWESPFRPSGR
jgi:hypothetical protein